MTERWRTITALFLLAVIFFCAITITNHLGRFLRIDLTENKLYTLSEGTRQVIEEIRQPLELKLYYSRAAAMKGPEGIRVYNNYYIYVRDLLREYEALSNGRLRLTVIDPRPYTDDELDAIRYGLDRYSAGDEPFFFGLAVASELGRVAVVPFFAPNRQPLVEYEISKSIYDAATAIKKPVGIITSLPLFGPGLSPYMAEMMRMQGREVPEEWLIIKQLKQFFDVVRIDDDASKIDDVELLILIHPKDLPEDLLFAVDQHVMKGGKLLVIVGPYCVADPVKEHHLRSSDMNELLEAWGCILKPNTFAADRSLGIQVQMGPNQPSRRLPTYMDLTGRSFNSEDVITAQLQTVRVLFGGAIESTDVPNVTFEPIMTTSERGNSISASPADVYRFSNPDMVERELRDGSQPVVLGARLTGRFQSNFSEGPPAVAEDEKEKRVQEVLGESLQDTTIVVYSDVDMINDFVAFRETFFGPAPRGDNVNLFLNTVENLGGARALSTARAKGRFNRPFEVFDRIEAEAEQATAEKIAAVEAEIEKYQKELQSIVSRIEDEGEALMRGEVIERKRELEESLLLAQRELRELNRDKRVRIESLISKIKLCNILAAPSVILLIAVIVFLAGIYRKKKYLGVRNDE